MFKSGQLCPNASNQMVEGQNYKSGYRPFYLAWERFAKFQNRL